VGRVKEAIGAEQASGALVKEPILGQSISFPSGGAITFLDTPGDTSWKNSENDLSIVFLLEYGETKWLFTGDLEEKGELKLIKPGLIPRVDVLKVGHHGSATSSTVDFLHASQPSLSVISAGADNKFGHPAASVLDNLQQIGSTVLRTDQLGDITLTTDGVQIWVRETRQRE
jgi:competence protein ComEC